jgi:hypothetical protein
MATLVWQQSVALTVQLTAYLWDQQQQQQQAVHVTAAVVAAAAAAALGC